MKADERDLVKKAKDGDMASFELLVKKYQQHIYYLCRRITEQHQSADDISQETFIKAFFSLSQFDDEKSFFPWIRKIAVNNCLNYLKKIRHEAPFMLEDEGRYLAKSHSIKNDVPLNTLEKSHLENKFEEALASLPRDQKVIFILRFYEDQSYQQIAKILQLPSGTVMSRLNRARKKIRKLLADYI